MAHSKPHILETDEYGEKNSNHHSSMMTSNTLGPTTLLNEQPTRIDQRSNSRFPDYALQQNSATTTTTTNSRISIPHPLASVHWDPPLTSPPPPWHPTFAAGYGSFISSTAPPPPYPLDTSSTTSSLFSDCTDFTSAPMLPEVSNEPFFREKRSISYSTENHAAAIATTTTASAIGTGATPAYYYKNGMDPWNYYHSDNQGKYNTNRNKKSTTTTDTNTTTGTTITSSSSSSLYTMPEESIDSVMPFNSPLNTPFFYHHHQQQQLHNRNNSHTNSYRDDNLDNKIPSGDDDDDDSILAASHRTRSKSSAPAFDIWYPSSSDTSSASPSTELKSRWLYQPSGNHPHGGTSLYTPFLSTNESQRSASLRRFSVQPSSRNQLSSLQIKDSSSDSLTSFSRRHSMAGPALQQQEEEQEEDVFAMASLENSIDELTKLPSVPLSTNTTPPTTTNMTITTTPIASVSTSSLMPSASTPTKISTPTTAAANKSNKVALPPTSTKDLYAKVAAVGISDPTSTTATATTAHSAHVKLPSILSTTTLSPATSSSSSSSSSSSTRHTLPKSETMGKGVKLENISKDANYCVVEFKAGRTDIYFSTLTTKKDDLVMVEADRGHDLGKVVVDSMTPAQLANYTQQQQQQQQQDLFPSSSSSSTSSASQQQQETVTATSPVTLQQQQRGEIRIKRLLRLARPEEIALLVSKNEDELKALTTCQARVQQRKLNIKVVNAEFQMDRRKLIFYFISEKRVDFRELVRDLFKIYKTRIWMCAVHDKTVKPEDSSST